MKNYIQTIAIIVILLSFGLFFLALGIMTSPKNALADGTPSVVITMSEDILSSQNLVKDNDQRIMILKQEIQKLEESSSRAKDKVSDYREHICKYFGQYCSKQYLDPSNSGVDLSVFLEMKAKL